jgi:hypothetical protein
MHKLPSASVPSASFHLSVSYARRRFNGHRSCRNLSLDCRRTPGLKPSRRERNFGTRRWDAKNRRLSVRRPAETKVQEMKSRKSPQKAPE